MPLSNRFLGIVVKTKVFIRSKGVNPVGLGAEHDMGVAGRLRQLRIHRPGDRMQEIGPDWMPGPKMAATEPTESSFMVALLGRTVAQENGPIGGQVFFACYLQGIGVCRKVDRIATGPTRFSTDRAITLLIRIRFARLDLVFDGLTVAAPFNLHFFLVVSDSSRETLPGQEPESKGIPQTLN